MRPLGSIGICFAVLIATSLPAIAATEAVIYSFPDASTGYASGSLSFRNGSLYGTSAGDPRSGNGQVFELTNKRGSWTEKTLIAFDRGDGAMPFAGLVRDSNGVLYGTTWTGDAYDGSNVFALSRTGGNWAGQTVWAFGKSGDGAEPTSDLVIDKSGNLYGTTSSGGAYNGGTVFELRNVNGVWSETVLHSFAGYGDGLEPYAGLLMKGPDTLYGTTSYGGNYGNGAVFRMVHSAGSWKLKVIYSFTGGAMATNLWVS